MITKEKVTTEHASTSTTGTTPVTGSTNVTATRIERTTPNSSLWTTSRVIALVFVVIETVLAIRFLLKLFGANAQQALASGIYAVTNPFVAPFQGIFSQPDGTQAVEIASLLAIGFFVLLAALTVAIVRAVTGSREGAASV
jgi:hypothetical protein